MKKTVCFKTYVEVEIEESKFDETFMKDFRAMFFDFYTLEDHIKHLAQLYFKDGYTNSDFIEGYGQAENMGIKFKELDVEIELEE